jgi:oxygen-dependent protoporphyrinogen oxidase
VGFVGAGISGLTLAFRLQQSLPDAEVVVLDQAARPGGTIQTLARDGFVVEAGPNGFPDNNPATLELAADLGLTDRLISASEAAGRNRYLLLDGRLRLVPNSLSSFLRSDLLSWVAKLRLLTERFRPRRRENGDESIDAFARRRVGDEVARTFVDAFVTGILAGDPKLLSAPACFSRLVRWEHDHGSVTRGMAVARRERKTRQPGLARRAGQMWSFQGGLGTLAVALAARLRRPLIQGVHVTRLRREGMAWQLDVDPGQARSASEGQSLAGASGLEVDAVVLTCPAYRQAEIVAELDRELAEKLAGIAYNRVAVVALGFRRQDVPHPLEGFGYLSPQRQRRDVLGVQWCSSIFPDRAPPGTILLRAMCGGWHRGEVVDWPEERLLGAVRTELATSLGVRVAPVFHEIVRWPRAIPQYHLGHLERVAWIEERLGRHPGLFLGGNAFRGVAINDCVEQAGLLAGRVVKWLASGAA